MENGKKSVISGWFLITFAFILCHQLRKNYAIGITHQVEEFFKGMPVGSGEICKTLQGTIAQSDHQEA